MEGQWEKCMWLQSEERSRSCMLWDGRVRSCRTDWHGGLIGLILFATCMRGSCSCLLV